MPLVSHESHVLHNQNKRQHTCGMSVRSTGNAGGCCASSLPIVRFSAAQRGASLGATRATLRPSAPARAVRPER